MNIGDVVTVTTTYGLLPGTHRGDITRRVGPWWEMRVWVGCRGRHEHINFSESQIVPDDTPITDLSMSARLRYESAALAAGVRP